MSSTDTFRAFFAAPLAPPVAGGGGGGGGGGGAGAAGGGRRPPPPPGPVCSVPTARWRVVPARLLHVTLRFLGDTAVELRPALAEALRKAARGVDPFPVSFRGWHLLPSPRDPRVLAVGVSDPSGTLPLLAAALEASARALGFPPENRPFLSHVTIARRKAGGRGGRGRGGSRGDSVHPPASGFLAGDHDAPTDLATCQVDPMTVDGITVDGITVDGITVNRITLVRSTLHPDGPLYEILEEAPLGASP